MLYGLIIISIMQSLLVLGVAATIIFTLKYSGVALIPLAIVLDGYYGAFFTLPLLSIAAVGWYVVSEVIRVRMSIVQSGT